jgi:NADPH:quinone reductase-like Zn-dependent oxidoreductase
MSISSGSRPRAKIDFPWILVRQGGFRHEVAEICFRSAQRACQMKILVAGATGVVGRRVVLLLTAAGHEVAGLTRTPAKADLLRRIGATPVIADALDPAAMMEVVQRRKPEIVVHELTSIKKVDLRDFDRGIRRDQSVAKRGHG